MSSFAEQLAARAAKRTAREGDSAAPNPSLSSPTRRSGDKIITPSMKNGSSSSNRVNSLSEQIKSRAVESSDKGRSNDVMMGKNITSDGGDSTVTTDETSMSSSQQQQINNQMSPVRISSSSSRSRRDENNSTTASSLGPTAVKSSALSKQKQQRQKANDSNNSPKRSDDNSIKNDIATSNPTTQPKSASQTPTKITPKSSDPPPTTEQLSKLKAKLDKYKSESKKLRHENLLLKAKSEEMATLLGQLQKLETAHKSENEGLSLQVKELNEQIAKLEMTHDVTVTNGTSDEREWNGIQSSIRKLREDRPLKHPLDGDTGSDTTGDATNRDSMVAKTAKLAQIILDTEGNNATGSSFEERDETISALTAKVTQLEEELADVTELKNAEIDVLRKQLNRVEHSRHNKDNHRPQDVVATIEQQQQEEWTKEREELREEIRRLNLEVSKQTMSNQLFDQEEEEDDTARYNGTSSTSLFITSPKKLDDSDVSSLQSIIGMMRQTIDQCNKEKDELEQRLAEEQERSQNELKAFAKTLEGVDDLRKSAETMSREIRRIKVKGYRPTRSDLMGVSLGGNLDGVRNFGELTAAVEASESMEDAIRMIEGQNDALEERRRLGVVAASVSREESAATAVNQVVPVVRKGGIGLRAISEDDDDEGGFLSFWHGAGRSKEDDEGDGDNTTSKKDKKKKSKRKKKRDDEGSVFTSFF